MISVRRGFSQLWYWGKRGVIGIIALWMAGILILLFAGPVFYGHDRKATGCLADR